MTEHRLDDEKKLCSYMCLRSKYYFGALVHIDILFAKGVPVVLARMPDMYYRCLIEDWDIASIAGRHPVCGQASLCGAMANREHVFMIHHRLELARA